MGERMLRVYTSVSNVVFYEDFNDSWTHLVDPKKFISPYILTMASDYECSYGETQVCYSRLAISWFEHSCDCMESSRRLALPNHMVSDQTSGSGGRTSKTLKYPLRSTDLLVSPYSSSSSLANGLNKFPFSSLSPDGVNLLTEFLKTPLILHLSYNVLYYLSYLQKVTMVSDNGILFYILCPVFKKLKVIALKVSESANVYVHTYMHVSPDRCTKQTVRLVTRDGIY